MLFYNKYRLKNTQRVEKKDAATPSSRLDRTPEVVIESPPVSAPENKERYVDKESISRRLPEMSVLRYHIPGYMGYVRRQQFHHGKSYGATTRECIMGYAPSNHSLID
jgi:hypothetical protein